MKLVAAAKVRRAQDAVLKTRPFSETLQKVLGGLTGDRGLCGGYNTYAIKKIETRAAELKEQGIDFDMIPIGNAPTADEATAISDTILSSFLAGECDRVEL